ncbi:Peptidyl-prolyl cis-trans isomerase CWC27 like protein [Eufriesea mexicana]|uniref:Spliceosome-associated protein CWC27 homolog n=1 Tax=Eufriesea mexicana TaxID=516756 RepID=A0A310SBA9_9HYME|nr:Peptidyl-prolyl cis-trans isomerase CWC27 like protein [Eufriesea mexicana]
MLVSAIARFRIVAPRRRPNVVSPFHPPIQYRFTRLYLTRIALHGRERVIKTRYFGTAVGRLVVQRETFVRGGLFLRNELANGGRKREAPVRKKDEKKRRDGEAHQALLRTLSNTRRYQVTMKTTVGDIELELWAKETPMACKNFIQLCLEVNYEWNYHDTIFHRIIQGFIAYGGDPTSTGEVFGKVTEETIYNMLKLEEALVGENDRPLYLPRFIKTIILNNPFSDIIPRIIVQESEEVKDNSKTKTTAVKDFNLLSFGEEAEEDEEESVILNKKFTRKGKSAHDHLTDPKLSSQPAVEPSGLANKKRKEGRSSDWESDAEVKTQEELEVVKKEKEVMKKRIKNTLRDTKKEPRKVQNYKIGDAEDDKNIKENE